jgi:voltage-gated potassium channel
MLVDAIALAPIVLEWLFPDLPHVELFRIVRFLKFARYSPALGTVGWVVLTERRALLACIVIIMGIMLASAAVMMAVEGHLQPNHLGDMPKAIWWSASMLAKIGGGETSPVTAAGRIIAALTVMLGIFCFALPVAILGRGFYAEIRKRDFVVTFAMVARVPLFADLDAGTIAELVDMLKARTVSPGAVIVRKGDRGDALYFLASGVVEVRDNGATVCLYERDYFGEMALLANAPRSATVVAARVTDLLVLEAEDFYQIVSRTPGLRVKMEEAARQRALDTNALASAN